jgi:hypothetical protein
MLKVVGIIIVAMALNVIVIAGGRRLVWNAMHKYYKAGDAIEIGGVTLEVTDVEDTIEENIITENVITENFITERFIETAKELRN